MEAKIDDNKVKPTKELWIPPKDCPAKVIGVMPREQEVKILFDLFFPNEEKPDHWTDDWARGVTNLRRKEIYKNWQEGLYDRMPELLNIGREED